MENKMEKEIESRLNEPTMADLIGCSKWELGEI